MAAAKAAKGGRKPKITDALRAKIVTALKTTPLTVAQVSAKFGVPVSTMYYHGLSRRALAA